jgi:hypothetical protein
MWSSCLLFNYLFRLAKSTLLLIPLLGVHEIIFSFITDDQVQGHSRRVRLFIQLALSSFHVSTSQTMVLWLWENKMHVVRTGSELRGPMSENRFLESVWFIGEDP